ncbi:unnamed protein product [Hydatigera taeniaeformis]|uniref:Aamy domain-containing protein n=1 Tax=Hydatigena taeniaeformis TaxID=6205 RepID=A0A0R3X9P7_HYDTA|nr:unnamed protein product [Hydatigera taeniaeformis]
MREGATGGGDSFPVERLSYIDGVKDESNDEYTLLTKEDLLRLDAEQPIWRRVRIALIALFWVVWVCLIVVSILYIVLTPKCPPRPVQSFWQSKVGYWVNPFAFKDSDGDLVGDLKGLLSAGDYIQENVGAGFLVLTSMSPLYPKILPEVDSVSFASIHPALGTMEDFGALLRGFKKRGMQTVISLNFNAVPLNHELAKPAYLVSATPEDKFCRAGNGSAELMDGAMFYSTYGSGSGVVDLNLKSPEVMEKVKNVTRFWLHKGVDGILLSDAAFFVEEGTCASDKWLSSFPTCKLYTNGTVGVIQELRKVVDEVSSETSRPRVLIADPGNTGYGASTKEDAEKLLGTEEAPGAHLVISRQFAFQRGFHGEEGGAAKVQSYLETTEVTLRSQLALVTASPSDKPYTSVYSTASMFLLPGTPVIYAGTEIGWTPSSVMPPSMLYPFGQLPVVDSVSSHLPMPWDSHGGGFSDSVNVSKAYSAYTAGLKVVETVEVIYCIGSWSWCEYVQSDCLLGATSQGVSKPPMGFPQRYDECTQGCCVVVVVAAAAAEALVRAKDVEVFKRSATGFDSIVVVMVGTEGGSSVLDLSSDCSSLVPLVVYPPSDAFATGVELSSLKVYFQSGKECSLYVFKCGV